MATFLIGLLATCLIGAWVQSLLVSLQAWEHLRNGLRARVPNLDIVALEPALVIAPVKGADPRLEQILESLFTLDYPDYELRIVGESEHEPARRLVAKLCQKHPRARATWVTAGVASGTGQKIHNLTMALRNPPSRAKILAFVDTDAVVQSDWLTLLVRRLALSKQAGAATGYRDLTPHAPNLANRLVYSVNAMASGLLAPRAAHNAVWGGSWAIRREVFESLDIVGAWAGKLADDYVATQCLRRAKLRIAYEPRLMALTRVDYTPEAAAEFAVRQFVLTRWYSPRLWTVAGLGWIAAFAGLCVSPVLIAALSLLGVRPWWASASWLGLYLLGAARAGSRQYAAQVARPELEVDQGTRCFDVLMHPLSVAWGLLAFARSGGGNWVVWRGVRYDADWRGRVLMVRRGVEPRPTRLPASEDSRRAA